MRVKKLGTLFPPFVHMMCEFKITPNDNLYFFNHEIIMSI